jgi:hypothetical protein
MMTLTTTTTTAATTSSSHTRGRVAVRIAAICGAMFVLLLVLGGLLDPGYSQRTDGISALASTESRSAAFGVLAFAFLALTAISTGIGVLRTLRGRAATVSGVLVILAGLATAADGVFRQSCSSLRPDCLARESAGTVSNAHLLHNLIALPLFAFLVLAGLLLIPAVRRNPAVRPVWGAVLAAALGSLLFLVWFGSGAYGENGGLVQRGLVLLAYGLPLAVAAKAARSHAR